MKNSVLIAMLFKEKKTGRIFQLIGFQSEFNLNKKILEITKIQLQSIDLEGWVVYPDIESFDEDFEAI